MVTTYTKIFGGKVVRQQHLTGLANHFGFLTCGNAVSHY
jgi:hypothetical protein